MVHELLSFLQQGFVLLSLALLAVLALRTPWHRYFGARNVMLLWLSVPVSLLALLLPEPVRTVEAAAWVSPVAATLPPGQAWVRPALEASPAVDPALLMLALWMFGVLALGTWLALAQWRYRRALGRLESRPDGSFRSRSSDAGPALVGALRPRIIVPADFDQRFSAGQRALILAHERCHLRRGDAQLTLLACLLRCIFWFNPLIHLAWSRFRLDQELACDATVLRAHPNARREYAEAMLFTQFKAPPLPVGCTWLTGNPLKRRITMLYSRPPSKLKLLAGTMLALTATTAAAVGSWSSQEPELRYVPADAPLPTYSAPVVPPSRSATRLAEPSAMPTAPNAAAIAAKHSAGLSARPVPAAPSTSAAQAPSEAPAAPATDTAPSPRSNEQARPQPAATVDVQPARLVRAGRPDFPRSFGRPELVSYPGMPESELPGPDWQPEGWIWEMKVRVALDENGVPVDASIAHNDLNNGGMVGRYERLAMRAARNWNYEPARIDGKAVPSEVVMAFHFDTTLSRPAGDEIARSSGATTPVFPSSVSRSFVRVNGINVSR